MAANGSANRRKSINFFARASMNLTQINPDVPSGGGDKAEKKDKKKTGKRNSIFGLGPSTSLDLQRDRSRSPARSSDNLDSAKLRPKTLQKSRPSSIFGSLGRKSLTQVDEGETDSWYGTPSTPPEADAKMQAGFSASRTVLFHGEVQTTSGMFRKKKEYLVLTDTHLLRFKSQARAHEAFPSIPATHARSNTSRHPSTASIGSLQEVQSIHSHTSAEHENQVPLRQIVTVYRLEDGRPFFTTEVVWLDEDSHGVGSLQLMLHDPKDADLWHSSIRGAAQKSRLLMAEPFSDRIVHYLVMAVEGVDDYDSNHFQIFRVVRRTSPKPGRSSDDLQKLGSSVFYLVVGLNKVHLVPPPEFNMPQGRLSSIKSSRSSWGIVSLLDLRVTYDDDRFELAFRQPMKSADVLELAASASPDIAFALLRAWRYLKPLWDDHNFKYSGPRRIVDTCEMDLPMEEDKVDSFDRTLAAYCLAYHTSPGNVQYAVDWEAEDAPEFWLWPPKYSHKYTLAELLAVMRSLRCNDVFRSISFRDIDLHSLHGTIDGNGAEHAACTTRGGISIEKYFNLNPKDKSLLYQEVQALALKSGRIRRMDFTNCLPRRRPRDNFDFEGREVDKDPGCEIAAALLPLCQAQLTNVDWIILNGIELGETDLDALIPAMQKPAANLRAIECSHCGLNDRGMMQLITHLDRQNATLEYINFSDNPGRINLEQFQASMSRFTRLRKLNLSRTTWTTGEQPLVLPEILMTWRLQELILDGVAINARTLESISTYLASDMSNELYVLNLDQCGLNGDDVALLMYAMTRVPGEVRNLELHVSANRFEKGVSEIVKAIRSNHAPTHLFLRMIDALQGLKKNRTLKTLRIMYQNLGLEGANTLSSVIEADTGLTHIYCEHNDINLQGFTTLVNAIAKNYKILHLPFLQDDQNTSMKRMNTDMKVPRPPANASKHDHHMKSSVRRTLNTFGVGQPKPAKPNLTPQDVDALVRVLNERWQTQMRRLALFLERNNNMAAGVPSLVIDGENILSEETMRPTTALSDFGILEQVLSNTTPKVEINNPVDFHVYNKTAAMNISVDATDAEEYGRMPSVVESDDEPDRPVTAKNGSTEKGKDKMFDLRNTEGAMFMMDT
ncbi:leucine rich repeat domain-containing protein [Diplocarpon rosae]|nr:leucine rich repeat domain-containing protein [Diplocarpon rosae]